MSASYLHGAFNGLSICLAASQLWALSDRNTLHTFNYKAACKQTESHKGGCTEYFVSEPEKHTSHQHCQSIGPKPTQSYLTAELVSIQIFHELHAQGQMFFCVCLILALHMLVTTVMTVTQHGVLRE